MLMCHDVVMLEFDVPGTREPHNFRVISPWHTFTGVNRHTELLNMISLGLIGFSFANSSDWSLLIGIKTCVLLSCARFKICFIFGKGANAFAVMASGCRILRYSFTSPVMTVRLSIFNFSFTS